jgi:kinesin family protein 11
VRVVGEQIQDLDVQMQDLDDFVSRAKLHNASHRERHMEAVQSLDATVEQSFSNILGHCKETFDRVQSRGEEVDADTNNLKDALEPLDQDIRQPLAELREDVQSTELREYEPTGETPQKACYDYPTDLPRTGARDELLAAMRESPTPTKPSPVVLPDINLTPVRSPVRLTSPGSHRSESLREVNPNLATGPVLFDPSASVLALPPAPSSDKPATPLLKPNAANLRTRASRLARRVGGVADGAENMPPAMRSSTRRKSPRLH